jgi:4-hydroxybenzoate polyprenyltransferase
MNYNIFIIIASYIYIFDLLKENEETYPLLFALTSTLFYRDFKKNFGELKAFYIGIFWTLGCVILPCVLHDNNYEILNHPSIYIPSSLLMFGSSNMLDIKDIDEDREEGINTLAVKLGKDKSELLSNSCTAIALIIFLTNFS